MKKLILTFCQSKYGMTLYQDENGVFYQINELIEYPFMEEDRKKNKERKLFLNGKPSKLQIP